MIFHRRARSEKPSGTARAPIRCPSCDGALRFARFQHTYPDFLERRWGGQAAPEDETRITLICLDCHAKISGTWTGKTFGSSYREAAGWIPAQEGAQ